MSFIGVITAIMVALAIICFYRAAVGPTAADRMIAINVIGTKAVVILCLVGYFRDELGLFLDAALVYALISFLASVGLARYFLKGRLSEEG